MVVTAKRIRVLRSNSNSKDFFFKKTCIERLEISKVNKNLYAALYEFTNLSVINYCDICRFHEVFATLKPSIKGN